MIALAAIVVVASATCPPNYFPSSEPGSECCLGTLVPASDGVPGCGPFCMKEICGTLGWNWVDRDIEEVEPQFYECCNGDDTGAGNSVDTADDYGVSPTQASIERDVSLTLPAIVIMAVAGLVMLILVVLAFCIYIQRKQSGIQNLREPSRNVVREPNPWQFCKYQQEVSPRQSPKKEQRPSPRVSSRVEQKLSPRQSPKKEQRPSARASFTEQSNRKVLGSPQKRSKSQR
eukprot:GEMP01039571.1.p1 GENE.GEMP01039571.1~~GEMP01039571.1.p1  ORF type:complete len:267 (+),score=9.23 GEMP01039571.1:109-801(+)